MFLRGLLADRRFFAPNDDQGSDLDLDDEDLSLDDEPEEDEVEEDQDDEDSLDDQGGDQDDGEEQQAAPRQSRATREVLKAKNEAKALRERTELLERQLADIQTRQNAQPQQQPPTQAQIDAHFDGDPMGRMEYMRNQDAQRTQQTLNAIRFESQENSDKLAYDSLCAKHPVAQKLKGDVETALANMRRQGTTAPRETILRYLIGERALANQGRATSKAKKSASENRDRQTARPTNGRTDSAPASRRGDNTAARDKRLENLRI